MIEVLNNDDYELFRKLIYDESGITFSDTNRSILDSRIKELLRKKMLLLQRNIMQLFQKILKK